MKRFSVRLFAVVALAAAVSLTIESVRSTHAPHERAEAREQIVRERYTAIMSRVCLREKEIGLEAGQSALQEALLLCDRFQLHTADPDERKAWMELFDRLVRESNRRYPPPAEGIHGGRGFCMRGPLAEGMRAEGGQGIAAPTRTTGCGSGGSCH